MNRHGRAEVQPYCGQSRWLQPRAVASHSDVDLWRFQPESKVAA